MKNIKKLIVLVLLLIPLILIVYARSRLPSDPAAAPFETGQSVLVTNPPAVSQLPVFGISDGGQPTPPVHTPELTNDYRPTPYEEDSEEYLRVMSKLDGSFKPAREGVNYSY